VPDRLNLDSFGWEKVIWIGLRWMSLSLPKNIDSKLGQVISDFPRHSWWMQYELRSNTDTYTRVRAIATNQNMERRTLRTSKETAELFCRFYEGKDSTEGVSEIPWQQPSNFFPPVIFWHLFFVRFFWKLFFEETLTFCKTKVRFFNAERLVSSKYWF